MIETSPRHEESVKGFVIASMPANFTVLGPSIFLKRPAWNAPMKGGAEKKGCFWPCSREKEG